MVEYRPTSPWTVDRGRVAQLVEQRTENPRVEGSSPPPTTIRMQKRSLSGALFCAPGCCRAGVIGKKVCPEPNRNPCDKGRLHAGHSIAQQCPSAPPLHLFR